jgi:hypothetical protein
VPHRGRHQRLEEGERTARAVNLILGDVKRESRRKKSCGFRF